MVYPIFFPYSDPQCGIREKVGNVTQTTAWAFAGIAINEE